MMLTYILPLFYQLTCFLFFSGNWMEDRSKAPPLKGPFADFGFREFTASHSRDYPEYQPGGENVFPRHVHRFGLVCMDTIDEAAYSYADGKGGRATFDLSRGVLPLSKAAQLELFRTTNKDSMAIASGVRSAAANEAAKELAVLRRSQFAPAAGGKGSVNIDRGKHTAGIAGEILRDDADARQNTFAQRSWMYGRDAGTYFSKHPVPLRPEVTYMSIPGIGSGDAVDGKAQIPVAPETAPHGKFAAWQASARTTTITATQEDMNKRSGRKVFADWP
jgi:hypothetical protein